MRIPKLQGVLAVASCLATGGSALAGSERPGKSCQSAGNQAEITDCYASEFKAADAKLNAAYKPFLASLDGEHQTLLRNAQRAWVAFRDADCALEASEALHGSMAGTLLYMCMTTMTNERIKGLANLKESLADYARKD